MGYGITNMVGFSGLYAFGEKEADFMIHGYKEFNILGQEYWLTTTHISLIIVTVTLIVFAIFARRAIMKANENDVPSGFQNVVELLVEVIDNLVSGSMGVHAVKFRNYVGTILAFILLSNISGLFGLRAPTADYGTTLALAIITFVMIQYNGFKTSGLGNITDLFKPIPLLFPINLIGEFATPVSMSLRLFGNVMAGTIMMGLWYGLLPWIVKLGLPSFLHGYFDLFSGCIQMYVFAMLTMVFITQKLETE